MHDVEDFYRQNVVPLDALLNDAAERERFYEWLQTPAARRRLRLTELDVEKAVDRVLAQRIHTLRYKYDRSWDMRVRLRDTSARLIGLYMGALQLAPRPSSNEPRLVEIDPALRAEVSVLKELIWKYPIDTRVVRDLQARHKRMIRDLFERLMGSATDNPGALPASLRETITSAVSASGGGDVESVRARLVCDYIAGLTDQQAESAWMGHPIE